MKIKVYFSGLSLCIVLLAGAGESFAEEGYVSRGPCADAYYWEQYEKAYSLCRDMGVEGDLSALYIVGQMYQFGQGVVQSDTKAFKWYLEAAKKGHPRGQAMTGDSYAFGKGVERSDEKARYWYGMAANQGFASAQYVYGFYFENGRGGIQSDRIASIWYAKSAKQGNSGAQYSIGLAFYLGKGTSKSYVPARAWFKKSAENGHVLGQYYYALFLRKGYGGDRDYKEAMKWYQKSSDQGDADADSDMAWMYEYGKGVSRDLVKAIALYKSAISRGKAGVRERLEEAQAILQVKNAKFSEHTCQAPNPRDFTQDKYTKYTDCLWGFAEKEFDQFRSLVLNVDGTLDGTLQSGFRWDVPYSCNCKADLKIINSQRDDRIDARADERKRWENKARSARDSTITSRPYYPSTQKPKQDYQPSPVQQALDRLEQIRNNRSY